MMWSSGAQISDICSCASSGRLTLIFSTLRTHQITLFAATLSWKSWRRGDRQSSILLPAVKVRMYVPLYLIMYGSGVSVFEIWVVILAAGRVGQSPCTRSSRELCGFEGSKMRLKHWARSVKWRYIPLSCRIETCFRRCRSDTCVGDGDGTMRSSTQGAEII